MNARIKTALLAVIVTAATMASGLAGAVPAEAAARAAARAPVIKTVIDTVFAGYVTGGSWRFRYVAATVPIAKCRTTANQNAVARIALATNTVNQAAHIQASCGGGHGSVRYGTVTHAEGMLRLSPHVGDVLKVSIYRDQAVCRDVFTATNTSTHRTVTANIHTPCAVAYRHAELGGIMTDFSGTWTPPRSDVRLWALQDTAITSYNGTHGTICGPWPAEKHLAAPVITIRMIPSGLSNGCRDFSVLLKGKS